MKARILIYVDSLIRDVGPARVIARMLEARGHKVALGSPPSFNFLLRAWRPHHVLHGQPAMVIGNYRANLFGPDHGPRVSIFPQEGMHTNVDTLSLWYGPFRDRDLARSIDKIFFWNKFEHDWVSRETALTDEQLVIGGGMRLDIAKFAGRPTRRTRRKRIGFIGRFTYLNRMDETPLGFRAVMYPEGVSAQATDDEVQILEMEYRTLNCFSCIIDHLVQHTDYTISIRGHQAEAGNGALYKIFKKKYGNRVEIDRSQSIYHWALDKDVLVSTNSTSLLEPYLAGTPIINVDKLARSSAQISVGTLGKTNEPILFKCYDPDLIPSDFDSLYRMIDACVEGTFRHRKIPETETYLKEFLDWPYAGSAIRRIVESIDESARMTIAERRPIGMPLAPAILGDVYYFYNVLFHFPGTFAGMRTTFYNRLLHREPDFVREVQHNIETDGERPVEENGDAQSGKALPEEIPTA